MQIQGFLVGVKAFWVICGNIFSHKRRGNLHVTKLVPNISF